MGGGARSIFYTQITDARIMPTLVERNALACEKAQRPRCVCACNGTLHGVRHDRQWIMKHEPGYEDELARLAEWNAACTPHVRAED